MPQKNGIITIALLCAAMMTAACIEVTTPEPEAITLSPASSVPTKGYVTGGSLADTPAPSLHGSAAPADRTIVVSAWEYSQTGKEGEYFRSKKFEKDGDGLWHGVPNVFWPAGSRLDMMAYSSATPLGDDLVSWGRGRTTDEMYIDVPRCYTQDDILFSSVLARSSLDSGGGVDMTFGHAQAWIQFRVRCSEGAENVVDLRQILMEDIYTTGRLTVTHPFGTAEGSWSFLFDEAQDTPMDDTRNALGTRLTTETRYLDMLLPEQPQKPFILYYTLEGSTLVMEYEYTLPTATWQMGHIYVYDITFSPGQIEIVPSVLDWNNVAEDVRVPDVPDPANGHDYVEIGGMKWATMNVGAESVTDYGLYFQWGDTQGYTASQVGAGEGQKYFDWINYKYNDGTASPSDSNLTKYNSTDGKTVLDLSDDGVHAAWGGNWRMPTAQEFAALGDAANAVWTGNYMGSGIAGLVVTDKTDSSKEIFFPAAGYAGNGGKGNVGSRSYYWSSSLYSSNVLSGCYLTFSGGYRWYYDSARRFGYSLRGILED